MKRLLILSMVTLITCCVFAQSPQKMSYQFVVRNPSDKLVTNQAVGVKISILQGSASGTVVFAETYSPNPQTNDNGLVSIEIGGGSGVTGTFSAIDWASGPYFLKTETDPTGSTNYTISGTSQLLSVPYAMHTKTAENGFSGSYSDLTNKPTLFSGNYNDLTNKPILFDGTWANITGKPTILAGYGITDAMNTSHAANGITSGLISNWNTAYSWKNHAGLYRPISYVPSWNEVTGKPTTLSGYGITDADGSVTNEIQSLSLSGTQLSLSNGGGTVTLPSSGAGDNWGTQVAKTNTTLTGEGTESSPLGVANTVITPSWANIQGKPELAAIATSGSFVDILSKPTTLTGYGITDAMSTSHASNGITAANITNWNTAFGWGNHAGLYKPVSYVPSWGEITGIPAGFVDAVDNVDDADNSITNEIQALSISGSSLTLSQGGGTVVIPGDNWGNQIVVTNATLSGSGTTATPLIIADNGVTSDKIANNAVTVAKLPAGATANNYLRGDGTWAIPSAGSITETDPSWSGEANETVDIGRAGRVGIGTTSPAALLHTQGTGTGQGNVLFVGEWKISNTGNPPVSGAGTRMMWYPDKAAFRAGYVNNSQWDAEYIGDFSTAMGNGNIASGASSTAMGAVTNASGDYSIAMGNGTTASGSLSTAMGEATIASGDYSIAMGIGTTASGDRSTAMGEGTIASSYASTTLGQYNVGGGNATTWVATDPLFEIGNGMYSVHHNAMTVLKNGNVGIGKSTPAGVLDIYGNSSPTFPQLLLTENEDDYTRLMFKNAVYPTKNWSITGAFSATDVYSILNFYFHNGSTGNNLMSILGNGNVGIGTNLPNFKLDIAGPANLNKGITEGIALRCNNVEALWYNGTFFSWGYGGTYNYFADPITIGNVTDPTGYVLWVQGNAWSTGTFLSSDARYKKNISTIDNALDKLMKIRGTTFEFRTNEFRDYQFAEGPQFGFIAQELENVFPEVVKTESNGYKSVNYNGMIPVLLESIKEQQLQIEYQQKQINELKSIVSGLISVR